FVGGTYGPPPPSSGSSATGWKPSPSACCSWLTPYATRPANASTGSTRHAPRSSTSPTIHIHVVDACFGGASAGPGATPTPGGSTPACCGDENAGVGRPCCFGIANGAAGAPKGPGVPPRGRGPCWGPAGAVPTDGRPTGAGVASAIVGGSTGCAGF